MQKTQWVCVATQKAALGIAEGRGNGSNTMLRVVSVFLFSWVSATLAQLHPGVNLACRDGFVGYEESCYKFFSIQASWPEAMVFCKAFGSQLAEITSDNEQTFIQSYMVNMSSRVSVSFDVWLGASDLLVEGEWAWASSREQLTYSKWKPGEPNNNNVMDSEDCLALLQGDNFVWNDAPCTLRMNFICEAPMDTVPVG